MIPSARVAMPEKRASRSRSRTARADGLLALLEMPGGREWKCYRNRGCAFTLIRVGMNGRYLRQLSVSGIFVNAAQHSMTTSKMLCRIINAPNRR